MNESETFIADTIGAAETLYKKDFEAKVRAFAGNNSGSILGDLASMVSFSKWENNLKFQDFNFHDNECRPQP